MFHIPCTNQIYKIHWKTKKCTGIYRCNFYCICKSKGICWSFNVYYTCVTFSAHLYRLQFFPKPGDFNFTQAYSNPCLQYKHRLFLTLDFQKHNTCNRVWNTRLSQWCWWMFKRFWYITLRWQGTCYQCSTKA